MYACAAADGGSWHHAATAKRALASVREVEGRRGGTDRLTGSGAHAGGSVDGQPVILRASQLH